jgi:flavin-dependent dehydrogenase
VGDAALSFDPLSSQGVYKALEGGVRATEAIVENWSENSAELKGYADWVYGQYDRYQKVHT